jgi:hypothetical protein
MLSERALNFFTIAALAYPPVHPPAGLHQALISMAVIAAGNSFFLAYRRPPSS